MGTVEQLVRTPGGGLWVASGVVLAGVSAITPVAWLLWIGWVYLGVLGWLEATHDRADAGR